VVGAGLLEHVVEYAGASWGRSRTPSSWVNSEGLVPVVASLCARLATWLLAFFAPLVLLLGILGLAALRRRVIHALALLSVEDGPHRLLAGGKAGGDVEQLVGVDRQAAPELVHEVPAGRTLEEGVHDLGLGDTRELRIALGEAPYEVLERLAGLLGARAQVPGVPRAYVGALEVPHEGANQVVLVVDLAGRQLLEPRPRRIGDVQWQVADDDLVGGGSAQLARQTIVIEPYTGSVSPVYLSIDVGWRKRCRKLAVRISRLNTWVPGGSGVGERSSRLS
jgi:hypothetical protein